MRRLIRWLPFCVMAAISLWVAAGVGQPRKPFAVDLSLTRDSLAYSIVKVKHYESTALFFVLGLLAVGVRKAWIAFWLAVGMGVAWELAESTGVRHTARLADFAPDLLGALLCAGALFGVRYALGRAKVDATQEGESLS